ncbi:MAG: CHASE domain-containing protein [Gammaproteobacteria bacterium]
MRNNSTNTRFSIAHQNLLPYIPVVIVAIFLINLGLYVDRLNSHAKKQELRHSLLNQVSAVRARLEGNINNNTMLVKGLVAAISIEPDMSKERFIALSSPLLSGHSQIRNIAAAPNFVIQYMNPVAGNEAAIGMDYRTIPEQFDAVKHARDTGELIMAGPVNLVQGGQGIIVRVPVFVNSEIEKKEKFWGIVSSVIDIKKFFTASGLYISDLDIAIRGKDALGKLGRAVFGENKIFELEPVLTDITLPHGRWQLAAIPKGGWLQNIDGVNSYRIKLFVIGFVILVPLFVLSRSMVKRRESEDLLRLLFKFSPVGIALNDYNTGAFIEVNNALLEQIGYTSDEFLKLSYWDITPEKYKNDEAIQLESLEQTGQYGPYEKEYIRKDGSCFPVLLKGMVINDASGNKMIWSFVEDISKRKQAEKSLRRSQKMDAIGQLTGGIAHDFNNILGVILGNVELLKSDLSNESDKVLNRINNIYKAGQRAVDLTKQLLSSSMNKSSKLDVTNINNHVEKIENLISRSVTPEIEVSHQLDNDLWLTKIDPGEFEDAVLNLSINARDAMAGHGHLIISTRNVTLNAAFCELITNANPGEYVELAVSDNGVGISAEQLEHIFEPFYTTKEEGKGTGLGLAMVYGFVQRSGGCIDVKSKMAVGTTIKLYLPRFEGKEQLPAEQNSKNNVLLSQGTETLLLVDDEKALLELASELLEGMGYKVLSATNGRQALEILQQEADIDLLFSDVVMPGGINGYKLAEQATGEFPNLKVLLTSGYTGKVAGSCDTRQPGLYSNILNKPYSQNELATRVRAILDEHVLEKRV